MLNDTFNIKTFSALLFPEQEILMAVMVWKLIANLAIEVLQPVEMERNHRQKTTWDKAS